jgi:hypothetical protein
VEIVPSGIDYPDRFTIGGYRRLRFKEPVFPKKVQKFFLHFYPSSVAISYCILRRKKKENVKM